MHYQTFANGNTSAPSRTANRFNCISGSGDVGWISGEDDSEFILPIDGKFCRLQFAGDAVAGAGNTWAMMIRKNGADTLLTASFTGDADKFASNNTDYVSFSAGDRVCIQSVPTSSPNASAFLWSVMFLPDDKTKFVMFGSTGNVNIGADYYIPVNGPVGSGSNSEFLSSVLIPTGITVTDMTAKNDTAPGVGNSRIFTLRKNGVAEALVVTNTGTSTINSSTDSIPFAENDTLSVQSSRAGTPVGSKAKISIAYVPDKKGEFILSGSTQSDLALSTTLRFLQAFQAGGTLVSSTTISLGGGISMPTVLYNPHTRMSVAPGVGNSRKMKWFAFGGSIVPSFEVSTSDTATDGTPLSTSAYWSIGDQFNFTLLEHTFVGTPAATKVIWACIGKSLI